MATVLVINEKQLLCDLLGAEFSQHGHEVYTSGTGKDGLELFRRRRPRFTFLDLQLPDMNGIEVLKKIREIDSTAAVLILTGAASDYMDEEARELGVTDFLGTGVSFDALMKKIQHALSQQRTPVSSPLPRPAQAVSKLFETEGPRTVLVVDDEAPIRDMLMQFLPTQGFRVLTAQDGQTALAMAESERPHCIVLDIHMPGMNGIEVQRKLRAKSYEGVIMMLTGSQDGKLLKEALNLGSIDIVGKPFALEHLALAIQASMALAGH